MLRHAPRATALLLSLAALALLPGCQTRVFSVQDGDMFRRSAASAPQDWSTQLQNLSLPRQVSTVQFKGQDGTALGGVFFKHPQAKATVLYFQGGGNHVQKDFRWLATLAADLPVNVLVWDYRGMGLSEGTGGTAHMATDSLAAAKLARQLGGEEQPLVYWGYSMGTLISSHLARIDPPDALILEGTLTTAQDWADNQVPWFAKPFVGVDLAATVRAFDNREALQGLRRPVLLLSGGKDDVTPPRFTKDVVAHMSQPQCATVVESPMAGHGGIHRQPQAREALRRFFERVTHPGTC